MRDGIVKVTRAGHDAPAAVVESIAGPLFSYEGRRVRLCVSAPAGSTLRGELSLEGSGVWEPWLEPQPIEAVEPNHSKPLELCFHSPSATLSGSVRLRFVLESPVGEQATIYSPDTLTALPGTGECVEDETQCCKGVPKRPAMAGTSGGVAGTSGATDGGAAHRAAGTGEPPMGQSERSSAGGCSIGARAARVSAASFWPWLAGLLGLGWARAWRQARRRVHCRSLL
jgi:hypothetical protein